MRSPHSPHSRLFPLSLATPRTSHSSHAPLTPYSSHSSHSPHSPLLFTLLTLHTPHSSSAASPAPHSPSQHPLMTRTISSAAPRNMLWREGAYRAAAVVFFTRTDGGAVAKVLVAVEDSRIAEPDRRTGPCGRMSGEKSEGKLLGPRRQRQNRRAWLLVLEPDLHEHKRQQELQKLCAFL